ncbi:MAG: hypothetical protein ACI87H_001629 [Gammaproteobacteria bacterium]|jgi:hypothetical protein
MVVLQASLWSGNALAEHENDHRYNIRGYILDAGRNAIVGEQVRVFLEGKLLEKNTTDSSGYYSLNLHIHNAELSKKLTIKSGSKEAEIRVSFDPADKNTIRIHHANFIGSEFSEGSLDLFRFPVWGYVLLGFLILGFIVVTLEKRRRRKLRLANHPPDEKKAKKKKKRKKH